MLTPKSTLTMTLRVLLSVSALSVSALSAEQGSSDKTTSELEFGVGYISDDLPGIGPLFSAEREGPFTVFNLDLEDPASESERSYWWLRGDQLGLSNRELWFQAGSVGSFHFDFGFSESERLHSETFLTPYLGVGSADLTLPENWVAASDTSGMSNLSESLQEYRLEQSRRRLMLGFNWRPIDDWRFDGRYQREQKEGLDRFGAMFASGGGNARAVLLPMPVDSVTDTLEFSADYFESQWQLRVAWLLSLFDNEVPALRWQNAFAGVSGWHPSASYPNGEGQAALSPDNSFQQLRVSGGYTFRSEQRVSADIAFGRARQDEAFLPYSINPVLLASVLEPLPRDSLNGETDSTQMTLRYSARPNQTFFYRAQYRFDDHDSNGEGQIYTYIPSDSALQNISADSSTRRIRQSSDRREQQLELEIGYRVSPAQTWRLGLQRNESRRDTSARERANENQISLNYQHQWSQTLSAQVRYQFSDRDGSTYVGNETFLSSHAPGYTETVAGQFENHPDLRQYYLANRQRQRASMQLNWAVSEAWQINGNLHVTDDDYQQSELGLTRRTATGISLDSHYSIARDWTLYLFLAHDQLDAEQQGHDFRGGALRLTQAADPNRRWFVEHQDRSDALGAGLTHEFQQLPLTMGLDAVVVETDSDIDMLAGAALNSEPLPSISTRLHSFKLYGRYHLSEKLKLNISYLTEQFDSDDWHDDGIAVDTLSNVLLSGNPSPAYRAHVIMLSIGYRF